MIKIEKVKGYVDNMPPWGIESTKVNEWKLSVID